MNQGTIPDKMDFYVTSGSVAALRERVKAAKIYSITVLSYHRRITNWRTDRVEAQGTPPAGDNPTDMAYQIGQQGQTFIPTGTRLPSNSQSLPASLSGAQHQLSSMNFFDWAMSQSIQTPPTIDPHIHRNPAILSHLAMVVSQKSSSPEPMFSSI